MPDVGFFASLAYRVILMPVIGAVSYEFLKFSDKHKRCETQEIELDHLSDRTVLRFSRSNLRFRVVEVLIPEAMEATCRSDEAQYGILWLGNSQILGRPRSSSHLSLSISVCPRTLRSNHIWRSSLRVEASPRPFWLWFRVEPPARPKPCRRRLLSCRIFPRERSIEGL